MKLREIIGLMAAAGILISAFFDPRILLIAGFSVFCQVCWLKMHGKPLIS